MIRFLSLLIFAVMLSAPLAAQAQEQEIKAFIEQVRRLNFTSPETNARFERPKWFIGRNVLDSTRSVIGTSDDFLVDGTGLVRQIVANVNVPGAGRQVLYFNFDRVTRQSISHVYELPLHQQEIADNLPDLLNAIGTAAGKTGDIFSLKRTEQAKILSDNGRVIAEVETAFLNDGGRKVESLLLTKFNGVMGYGKVAIPFDPNVLHVGEDRGRLSFYMPRPYEQALVDYVRQARR